MERMSMLEGIKKEAISAWYTKLMRLNPKVRANLLQNWNKNEAIRLLGSGARNVTPEKANYKVYSNRVRRLAERVMPKGQGAAGHGMEHVRDVTKANQIMSGSRPYIGNPSGKDLTNVMQLYSHNAVTNTPVQRQAVLSALMHDVGKAGEKALKSTASGDAIFKANPFVNSHAATGAKASTRYFSKHRALAQRAGLGRDGSNKTSRAILGHNPATWGNPAGSAASKEQAGRLLRFADDGVGNVGPVGFERTVGHKGLPETVEGLQAAGRKSIKYAKDHNLAPYSEMMRDVPVNGRPLMRALNYQYWNGLDAAANRGVSSVMRNPAGKSLAAKAANNASRYGLQPIQPSQTMPSYFLR